ncbi:MAG: sulfite exporter TauE/SafE family protein [Chloroflexota bacterium]
MCQNEYVDPTRFLLLVCLGLVIGAYGTLIGSGGGFILVPVLIFLYPEESTGTITSISLAVVFVNALSGSLAYARQGIIQYRVASLFGVAALPGSVIGALVARNLPRSWFDAVFGVMLIGLTLYLLLGQRPGQHSPVPSSEISRRTLTIGAAFSLFVGFLSSVLGIGGGPMHVPMMVRVLKFRFAVAAATSQCALAAMSLVGTLTHILTGEFETGWRRTGALSLGVLLGAQVGARLSRRLGSTLLTRLLSGALLIIGVRLISSALF